MNIPTASRPIYPRQRSHDSANLVELLRHRTEQCADREAYIFLANGKTETGGLTYGELDRRARSLAAWLQEAGLADERVLMLFPPGLEYVVGFFGCLYARAVPVPAYPPRPNRSFERLQAIVGDARPALILTTEDVLAQIRPRLDQTPDLAVLPWATVEGIGDAWAASWREPRVEGSTLAFLQYTSGSTATPKGVMVSHGNLLHNESMIERAFGQDESSVIVGWLPLFHDMGLIGNVLQPLYVGARCILMPPLAFLQRPVSWLEAISRYRATTSGGPNFAYDLCVRKVRPEQQEELDLSSWAVAFNGAEPVRKETLDRFAAAFEPCGFRREAFYPCYGLAEATLFVSGGARLGGAGSRAFEREPLERNLALPAPAEGAGARALVSCGHAWLEQRIEIVDPESAALCEPGRVGEIWVAGPSVAQGYWNRSEESERTFAARLEGSGGVLYLRTGDLGFFADGELYVTGRLKDLLIIRGRNHYPQDLERTVERCHPALRPGEGAAFAVEAGGEERLVVAQEVARGSREEDPAAIVEAIRQAVAEEHEIQVHAVALLRTGSILKTSSGKIQRRAVRQGFLDGTLETVFVWRAGAAAEVEDAAASGTGRGAIEEWIAARVASRLGFRRAEIDVARPLALYGLDSLADIELVHALESELGVSLPASSFLQDASIAELARRIEALLEAPAPADLAGRAVAPAGEIPLSRGQQALWFLYRLAPESAAYNVVFAARVRGPLDVAALRRAFQALADRHALLRVRFAMRPEGPVQIVEEGLPVPFHVEDATGWTDARLDRRLDEEAHRPFDLTAGPAFRVHCWSREGEHLLLLAAHHIGVDLWSLAVLMRELGEVYPAAAAGGTAVLPPLATGYGDYVRWQEERIAGERGARLWDFWRERLGSDLPLLDLATDHPRPPVQTFAGARESVRLGRRVAEGLAALAAGSGTTLFTVLLAAYQALLGRRTGQEEVVVGTPTTGRTRSRFDSVVGYFVNPVAIRLATAGEPTFRQLLAGARAAALSAFEHQDLPFALLVDRLQPERDLSRSPLFQTMLVLEQVPAFGPPSLAAFALGEEGGRWGLGPLELESVRLDPRLAQFDLTLSAAPVDGGLIVSLQYNTDLLDAVTVRRMAGHFAALLDGVLADPDALVSRLPLLGEAERHHLLWELNDDARGYPSGSCLHHLFERQAERTPEAVALLDDETALTYRELEDRASRLADHLRGLGAGPEVPVGILMERGHELIVGLLGILKAGGAYVPLDLSYPRERILYTLADARAPILLAGRSPEWLPPGEWSVVRMGSWDERAEAPAPPGAAGERNLAYTIYTSGSTGRPKGVAVEHHSVVTLIHWCLETFGPEELQRVLFSTSICFDISIFEIFAPLSCGGTVVVVRDALELPASPHAGSVTLINTVPSALRELLRRGPLPESLVTVCLAGEPLPRDLVEQAYANPRVRRVLNLYGPSEDTTFTTVSRVPGGTAEPPAIGRPLADTRLYIASRCELLPLGLPGELLIGGKGLTRGYLHRADLTAERFVPDPFGGLPGERLYRTGDLARYRPDGEIEFLGRVDHQVKVRGFRIELGEIETLLRSHEAVREAVVLAREDRPGDLRLVAYVTGRTERTPSAAELRGHLRRMLPHYMIPQAFLGLAAFPLTKNGKIDRRALPVPEAAGLETGREIVSPRSPAEEVVAEVWAEVLGLARVGVTEDFFDLGGHSLKTTQVITRLADAFQVDLPVRTLFEVRTVRALAALVEEAVRSRRGIPRLPITPVPRPGGAPLSFAQERLWFLHRLRPGSAAYNMAFAARLEGPLDPAALARSLGEIVRRHEALRTVFPAAGDLPLQVAAPEAPFALDVVDLSGLPAAGREEAAQRFLAERARVPFDLEQGPLLRTALLRLGGESFALFAGLHHIVADGWSLGLFLRELAAYYEAFVSGAAAPLWPELPVQYADYAVWQRRQLDGEALALQLAAWRRRLAGAPAHLDLPADRPRPLEQSLRGASLPFALPGPLTAALGELGRRHGATRFMVLLAGFQALLSRASGQTDVVVGTPVANRGRTEIEPLIGCFVNTLALRTDLSGDPGFGELLGRVRETALEAYALQDVPFERLVTELGVERDLGRTPLFQVMLVPQAAPLVRLDLAGVRLTPEEIDTGTAKFDLTLFLPEEEGLAGRWEHCADLFDAATVKRLAGHFERLLATGAAEPERRLSALSLLAESERQQLLVEWNDTARAWPAESNLVELFEHQARRAAGETALLCGGRSLTYGELDRRAGDLARRLRARGVGPEARVALLIDRSIEMVVAALAVLKAGGAYLPLDPEHPPARLRFLLEDAAAALLLTVGPLAGRVDWQPRLVLDAPPEEEDDLPAGPLTSAGPENLAYVIYTSGSTGRPKGVMVAHRTVSSYLRWSAESYGMGAGAGAPVHSPLSFDLTVTSLWGPLVSGGSVELLPSAPGLEGLQTALETPGLPYGVLKITPSHLEALGQLLTPAAAGRARVLVVGGEALAGRELGFWARHAPAVEVVNEYGPTEATVGCCVYRRPAGALAPGAVPIGRPIANARLYLLDEAMQPVPAGTPGELYIGGDGLARGYLGRPDLTAERFLADPFGDRPGERMYRTGDRVRCRPDGVLEFLGRIDHQVKIRGFRIELGEVEAALLDQPGVEQAVVIARDDLGSRQLVAYVVGASAPEPAALRRAVSERLPEPLVPSAIVRLEALPLTPNGKVDRPALPAPDRQAGEALYAPPGSPEERLLAEIWGQVLHLDRIGVHDNFFHLGGDSILSIQVIARAQRAGLRLTPQQLFQHPTIARLARAAGPATGSGETAGPIPADPVDRGPAISRAAVLSDFPRVEISQRELDRLLAGRRGEPGRDDLEDLYPLTPLQQGMLFHILESPGSGLYLNQQRFTLQGDLNVEALRKAFQQVVDRHQALRTAVSLEIRGEPLQVVCRHASLPWEHLDWRDLSPAEQARRWNALLRADRERGFELSREPLIRLTLVRFGDDLYRLIWSFHLMLLDGWSVPLILREALAIYDALRRGREAELEPPVSYGSYIDWLRRQDRSAAEVYWRGALQGLAAPTPLGEDRTATGRPDPEADYLEGELRLDEPDSAALRAFAGRHQLTVNTLVQGAWALQLSHRSGVDDVVFGSVVAGRPADFPGVESTVGLFLNTLPVRARVAPEAELLPWLQALQAEQAEARRFEFSPLVDIQQWSGLAGGQALFESIVIFQNIPIDPALAEGSLRLLDVSSTERNSYPVTLVAVPGPQLLLRMVYDRRRFHPATVARMLDKLRRLLMEMAAHPESSLAAFSPNPESERRQLIDSFNQSLE